MITLTTPPAVKSVLGGNTTVSYNKFILSQIVHDPVAQTINGLVQLTSTAEPTMNPIIGRFKLSGTILEIEVEQLDFYRRVTLTTQQRDAYRAWITTPQNEIEAGFVALGVIAGVQSAGA
ncbi:hypothetical protein [Luteitalea sp.]|uniref:hypothetical protein n=1 Tax=Luteitalea sp. TaxID=2004800 RepID=UPI0025C709F1|nr:hypothetical protein [Luteitalea sp.]